MEAVVKRESTMYCFFFQRVRTYEETGNFCITVSEKLKNCFICACFISWSSGGVNVSRDRFKLPEDSIWEWECKEKAFSVALRLNRHEITTTRTWNSTRCSISSTRKLVTSNSLLISPVVSPPFFCHWPYYYPQSHSTLTALPSKASQLSSSSVWTSLSSSDVLFSVLRALLAALKSLSGRGGCPSRRWEKSYLKAWGQQVRVYVTHLESKLANKKSTRVQTFLHPCLKQVH